MPKLSTDQIILSIYDSVLDPELLPHNLHLLARSVGAISTILFNIQKNENGERKITSPGKSPLARDEILVEYLQKHTADELRDHDIFLHFLNRSQDIQVMDDSILADSDEELYQLPNARFMIKNGIKHRSAALLNKDNVLVDRVGFQYRAKRGRMTKAEKEMALKLLPHFSKALSIRRPLEEANRIKKNLFDAMNVLKIGICVTDKNRYRIFENDEFIRIREDFNALAWSHDKRLQFRSGVVGDKVNEMVSEISSHGHFGARPRKEAVILDHDDKTSLCLEVCPFFKSQEIDSKLNGGAIIVILDTTQSFEVDLNAFESFFGMTLSEREILSSIIEGHTNRDIADMRDKSIETVNSQVKSILSKTDASGRIQLVKLATSLTSNVLIDAAG